MELPQESLHRSRPLGALDAFLEILRDLAPRQYRSEGYLVKQPFQASLIIEYEIPILGTRLFSKHEIEIQQDVRLVHAFSDIETRDLHLVPENFLLPDVMEKFICDKVKTPYYPHLHAYLIIASLEKVKANCELLNELISTSGNLPI